MIRFTPEDKAAIHDAARRSHLSASTWVRAVLLDVVYGKPNGMAGLDGQVGDSRRG